MVRTQDGRWAAAEWRPVGRIFTREQAEGWAMQCEDGPRFLLPYSSTAERFTRGERLEMKPDETLWDYGEPLDLDLRAVLRAAVATESLEPLPEPSAGRFPVGIATVRELSVRWFGSADPHKLELAFDELLFDLGGQRHDGDPAVYLVPYAALQPG